MTMKLSDAIRVGAKLRPASEHGWLDAGPDGELRTCALMAAAEGARLIVYKEGEFCTTPEGSARKASGIDARTGVASPEGKATLMLPAEWCQITLRIVLPPCACAARGGPATVEVIIWHLHDLHRWSREAVAEWVGTLENSPNSRPEKKDQRPTLFQVATPAEHDVALKK